MKTKELLLFLFIAVLTAGFASCGNDDEENNDEDNQETEEEVSTSPYGDYYYSDGTWSETLDNSKTCIGLVFRAKTETEKGLVVSLKELSDDVLWANDAFETLATNKDDGSVNMTTIQNYITANGKSWNDFPTFNYVVTEMNGQTSYSPTRDKWYLPAVNEFKELAATLSGKVYKDINNWGNASPMPGYDDPSCVKARAAFNKKLNFAKGTKLDLSNTGWYFSSTELNMNIIYSFGFEKSSASYDQKTLSAKVRAILAF